MVWEIILKDIVLFACVKYHYLLSAKPSNRVYIYTYNTWTIMTVLTDLELVTNQNKKINIKQAF